MANYQVPSYILEAAKQSRLNSCSILMGEMRQLTKGDYGS